MMPLSGMPSSLSDAVDRVDTDKFLNLFVSLLAIPYASTIFARTESDKKVLRGRAEENGSR